MNFRKTASLFLLIFAVAAASANLQDSERSGAQPAFSSPDASLAGNGDRTSHYPPYFQSNH